MKVIKTFFTTLGNLLGILLVIALAAALGWYAWTRVGEVTEAIRPPSPTPTRTFSAPPPDTAIVDYVIDGDTVDVAIDGQEIRVRLLNIDTPETKDRTTGEECLGPEATAYLTGLLPKGTEVRLEYDRDRKDKWGRTLAALYVDKKLINAEVARAGFSAPLTVGRNDRFLASIATAADEARKAGRGLYDAATFCTMPGQVKATKDALVVDAPAETSAGYDAAADEIDTAITYGRWLIARWQTLDPVKDQGLLLAYSSDYRQLRMTDLDGAVRTAEAQRDAWRNRAVELRTQGK